MGHRPGRAVQAVVLAAALIAAARPAAAAQVKIASASAGLNYEYFARTVVWPGDEAASRLRSDLLSARIDLGLGGGAVVSFSAGLASTDDGTLTFSSLPVSLRYDGDRFAGFALGAGAVVPVVRLSRFEIGGAGRIVYAFGASKTWPLEGFAVEGEATGKSSWMEGVIGPRISYLARPGLVPYLELCLRWLHAGFDMTETLGGDLAGSETKRVDDLSFSAALGADASLTPRLALKAQAGLVPFSGGIDGLASVALLYRF